MRLLNQVKTRLESNPVQRQYWGVSGNRTDGVRVTQTDLLFMGDNPLIIRWKARPFTNRTFRVVFDSEAGVKFKLRFLSSC